MSRFPFLCALFGVATLVQGADPDKGPRVVVTAGVEKEDPKFRGGIWLGLKFDPAKLFSEAGAEKIQAALKALAKDKRVRVIIETRTALTAEEARWLKEMMDAEKDAGEKKELEAEFKGESRLGRKAIYDLFRKARGGK